MKLAGLDIETTGTDPYQNHRLIQIGIVLPNGYKTSHDVQPTGSVNIDEEAMKINGFTLKRLAEAMPTWSVDHTLSSELDNEGYKPGELTPVGFNVGGFDMVFVKKELPKTAKFFSYRTLDLTGVAMMLELRTGKSYRELKEEFHKKIAEKLGRDERHDALYDAEAALVAVELFKEYK